MIREVKREEYLKDKDTYSVISGLLIKKVRR